MNVNLNKYTIYPKQTVSTHACGFLVVTIMVITMVTKRPCNTLILHEVQSNVQRTTALFRQILIDIQTHST